MSTGTHGVRRLAPFTSVAALLVLAGCASVTPIGQLLDNPSKYDGKTVRVDGEVATGARVRGSAQLGRGTVSARTED